MCSTVWVWQLHVHVFVLKPHSEDNKESSEHKEEVSYLRDSDNMLTLLLVLLAVCLCMASNLCHGVTPHTYISQK